MNAASVTQPSEKKRRSPRSCIVRLRRTVLVIGAALAVAIGGGVVVYCFPPSGDPTDADLVYVIGPATGARMDEAEAIIRSTGREDLLISVSAGNTAKFAAAQVSACSEPHVTCEHPVPSTTKGEALLLDEYVKTHDVHKVVVLTVTPHVARTRYIFARCAPDIDVQVIPVDEHLRFEDWVHQFGYQTTAFAKAITTPCASDDE